MEVFCLVAEKESFSEAARILLFSQPSVSFQIQALENELGTKLFHRTKHGISLSFSGKTYYKYAKEIIKLDKQARSIINSFQKGKQHMVIGIDSNTGNYFVSRLLGTLKKFNENLVISCEMASSVSVIEKLQKELIDIGVSSTDNFDRKKFEVIPFVNDELVLILPNNYWDGEKSNFLISDLISLPLVMRERGSGIREFIEQKLVRNGIYPKNLDICMEITDNEIIKEVVQSGLGAAIVSKWSVKKEVELGLLKEYISTEQLFHYTVNLILSRKKHEENIYKEIINFVIHQHLDDTDKPYEPEYNIEG